MERIFMNFSLLKSSEWECFDLRYYIFFSCGTFFTKRTTVRREFGPRNNIDPQCREQEHSSLYCCYSTADSLQDDAEWDELEN